jgi:hypothetical protein
MCPVLQGKALLTAHQPKVCFMNQPRGQTSVIRALAPQVLSSHAAQLMMDQGHQEVERGSITPAPPLQ